MKAFQIKMHDAKKNKRETKLVKYKYWHKKVWKQKLLVGPGNFNQPILKIYKYLSDNIAWLCALFLLFDSWAIISSISMTNVFTY